jgi:D-alanyl-lipoteichoic acid acyltransferase DltB (MBOAT superfamily)
MLFNSYPFIFAFLPVVLAGYFLIGRRSFAMAALWLGLASLAFYGWWNPRYVALLLVSIAVNFVIGRATARARESGLLAHAKALLVVGLVFNLGLLGFFKYANFFVENVNALGAGLTLPNIILPLGISFFTFTQIAFLVDAHRGIAKEYSPIHYLLFVTYFPHLIAGPVLHHKEMMPQFADPASYRWSWENMAVGLTIFSIGLAKKVLLADEIGQYVAPVFDTGEELDFFRAWGGALAYTLQLYFDFSGYSDMAIGLSRLFGIRLPLNFDSPYKAGNIIEFWRRWHMTLSRFLRDYLYFSLGGNRHGSGRRYANLMATMVLGGLWHGAGWTFVIWGTLHGVYLAINHAWREGVARRFGWGSGRGYRLAAWLVTFLAVVVGWVFFRAQDFHTAMQLLDAMTGGSGFVIPQHVLEQLPALQAFGFVGGDFPLINIRRQVFLTLALLALAVFAPNTQELMRRFDPALDFDAADPRHAARLAWQPSVRWFAFASLLLACCLVLIPQGDRLSEFLYFQF